YAIIGAFGDETNGNQSGAAYIFERSGSEWIEIQKLIPDDNVLDDRFGRGVAIWGNFVIVGAPYDDEMGNNSGSAYIYQLIDGVWEFDQKILAFDGSSSDWFGWTVSIWEDYVLVGAQNDFGDVVFSGSAFVFKNIDGTWTFQTKLLAPDGDLFDNFGLSLDIRNGYAIVGADENDGDFADTGAAYIYKNADDNWNFEMKLTASNVSVGDNFGHDVAITDSMAVVSSVNNDTLVNEAGAVYVFKNQGDGVWVEDDILISPETIVSENFGINVDFNGQFLIAGTTTGFGLSEETGSVYLHTYNGNSWEYEQKLYSNDGEHADFFGTTTAMHGSTVMIGALGDDSNGGNAGSVYMYQIECAPVCTELISPFIGDTMYYSNELMTWDEVSMADGFMLSVGTESGLDDIFELQDVGDTTSYLVPLIDQVECFVTIQSYNSFGITEPCNVASFFTNFITIQGFLAEDVIVSCESEIPIAEFSYIDSCSVVSYTLEEEVVPEDCGGNYSIIRTLIVTDDCNSNTTSQVINFIDVDPPEVIEFTEILNVTCGESIPLVEPVCIDNCSDFSIQFIDAGSLSCGETILRTFSIFDDCGNTTEVVQNIIIGENSNPPGCTIMMAPQGNEIPLSATLEWTAITGAEGYLINAGTSPGAVDILDMFDVENVVSYGPGEWPVAETIYISIIPYNEFGEASACQEAHFETILVGIDEIHQSISQLNIYPNPSFNKVISISIPGVISPLFENNIEIYDLSGRIIDFKMISGDVSNVNNSSSSEIKLIVEAGPGFYLLKLNQDNGIFAGQFCLMK
ncbi:MAG: hypothetical protein ACI8YO_001625, partial [Gammaproteobacteria bacterium]